MAIFVPAREGKGLWLGRRLGQSGRDFGIRSVRGAKRDGGRPERRQPHGPVDSQVRVAAGLRFASECLGAVGCGLNGLAQGLGLALQHEVWTHMNKQELIDAISSTTGATLYAILHAVTEVTQGEVVQLIGFGTFATGARAARTGRNPATGAEIQIPAAKTVKFSAGKAFKDVVNA